MNIYLLIILIALVAGWLLDIITGRLNLRSLTTELPEEFEGEYDAGRYARSQEYTRAKIRFSEISSTVNLLLLVGFILLGGFNLVDGLVSGWAETELIRGLYFFGVLMLLTRIIGLPFSIYHSFVLEEKFGFNRTTPSTFILDQLKGLLVSTVLMGLLLSAILALFINVGPGAWLWVWLIVSLFTFAIPTIFITVIAPLFNKFTPLVEGELKDAISDYARRVSFSLKGIFVVDGSRRSGHSNAYFTGLGRVKRIVLYDTLVEKHTTPELVAVLAHEVGHYRLRHVAVRITLSIAQAGILLCLLSLFFGNEGLFDAFRMEQLSVYGAILFFQLLFAPVGMLIGPWLKAVERKHEFAADAYAVKSTGGDPAAMISALKRLTVENLGNLTPHQLDVILNYDHPPVLQRIRVLQPR